jgi:hypothetical protein
MQLRKLRTTACLATALTVILAAGVVSGEEPTLHCVTGGNHNWEVTATPIEQVACQNPSDGDCSAMHYTITPTNGLSADHVVTLVDYRMVVESTGDYSNRYIQKPDIPTENSCLGDNLVGLGSKDCSRQSVRMNDDGDTEHYTLSVVGPAALHPSSIVIKKGKVQEWCRISALGVSTCNSKAQQATKKTFEFEDCIVQIELDPCTGEPGEASVISGACAIDSGPVESLQLVINGTTQNVTVGDGWISSGENSCTTTLFGGKKYTTCTCKDLSDCSVKNSSGAYICGRPCPR